MSKNHCESCKYRKIMKEKKYKNQEISLEKLKKDYEKFRQRLEAQRVEVKR